MSATELRKIGYSIFVLRDLGFTPAQLREAATHDDSLIEMRRLGYGAASRRVLVIPQAISTRLDTRLKSWLKRSMIRGRFAQSASGLPI